jgi:hypothetical protein
MPEPIRVAAARPLLVAIGPRAIETARGEHADLELVDLLEVEATPAPRRTAWLRRIGMFERSHTICLFDVGDEYLWQDAAELATLAQTGSELPVWFVCVDRRPGVNRTEMLQRLATKLGVCVIDPGYALLDVALMAAAALFRPGLVGFHPSVLMSFARGGTVLVHPLVRGSQRTDDALIVLRTAHDTSLNQINDVVANAHRALQSDASLFLAAPGFYGRFTLTMLERVRA